MVAALCAVVGAGVLAALVLGAASYPDAPPPGHTGGFGEPTCLACHAGGSLNEPDGTLVLAGVPETYVPGRSYPLSVRLSHPELRRAGFQLSARFTGGDEEGSQAGSIAGCGPRVAVTAGSHGRVRYAHQTLEGSGGSGAEAAWTVRWTAPPVGSGPVAFHLAANAANDDASEFGDFVYALERTSAPDP